MSVCASMHVISMSKHVTIHAIPLFTFMGGIIMGHQLFLRALPAATKTEQQASSLLA